MWGIDTAEEWLLLTLELAALTLIGLIGTCAALVMVVVYLAKSLSNKKYFMESV